MRTSLLQASYNALLDIVLKTTLSDLTVHEKYVQLCSSLPTGTFECSDPLITRLHKNVEWSMKSNFPELPTDCPQRERAGWTGDAQIFAPSASFLMDTRTFFRKWLKELAKELYSPLQASLKKCRSSWYKGARLKAFTRFFASGIRRKS